MSKGVENKANNEKADKIQNVNIGRELIKKQVFDCVIIFITFCVIFYFVCFQSYEKYDLLLVLVISFLINVGLLEFSRRAVKTPLNTLVENIYTNTIEDINKLQVKNTNQKEKPQCHL